MAQSGSISAPTEIDMIGDTTASPIPGWQCHDYMQVIRQNHDGINGKTLFTAGLCETQRVTMPHDLPAQMTVDHQALR
jgi:hypothetical protein